MSMTIEIEYSCGDIVNYNIFKETILDVDLKRWKKNETNRSKI